MSTNFIRILLSCFTWAICISMAQAQQTYSKTYHLEVGNDNRAQFFFLSDSNFTVATTHDGDMEVISALTRFNLEGEIVHQNSFSDYVFGVSRSVVRTDNGFEIAGHRWSSDDNLARGLEIVKVNNDLDFVKREILFYQEERSTNLPGIVDLTGNQKAVYGSFVKITEGIDGAAYVAFLDKASDSIQSEVVFRGPAEFPYIEIDVFDLQETIDSNMVFIAETRQRDSSASGSGRYFEIVKFNREGEILNRIKSTVNGENKSLFQDNEGGVYFFNKRTPFYIDSLVNFLDGRGAIVKLNESLDSVLWSFEIDDRDGIDASRGHTIWGISQLQDGDLLACGRVGLTVDNVGETIGFLCKFTKEGEIVWVREYGIPIPEEHLELEYSGVLSKGRIEDCKELPDGRILCMGEHAYAIPGTSFYQELWILMLDADGCLESGCDATQVLTSTSETVTFNEGKVFPNPVTDILHISEVYFDQYKIYDMMGRLVMEGGGVTFVDLSTLTSSMYVLQLKEEGKLKSVFKFLK